MFQNYSKATTLEFCFATICDDIQTMKYFVFISNKLVWASDCSYFVLVFWHNLSIRFLIKFVLKKQSMISKYFMAILKVARFWLSCILWCQLKKWVLLFHDTWSNDSRSNNAWFMHKIVQTIWNYEEITTQLESDLSWTK